MFQVWKLNMIIQTKNVYNIEQNGGKPQKKYIRPYYNLIGAKKKHGKRTKILLWKCY